MRSCNEQLPEAVLYQIGGERYRFLRDDTLRPREEE